MTAGRGGRSFRQNDTTTGAAGEQASGRGSRTHWHNWRLPTKLIAVVLAPVVFAILLGAGHITEQIQLTSHYEELGRQVEARDKAQPLLTGLQEERTLAVSTLAGVPGSQQALAKVTAGVDKGIEQAPSVLGEVGASDESTQARYQELREQFVALMGIREAVRAGDIDVVTAVEGYNRVVSALLSLERAVIRGVDDPVMNSTVTALYELSGAEEEIRVQQALGMAGFVRGDFTEAEVGALNDSRVRLTAKLTEFRAATTPQQYASYEETTLAPQAGAREAALDTVLASEGDPDSAEAAYPDVQQWTGDSRQVIAGTTKVRTELSGQLEQRAVSLQEDASDSAGLQAVVLLSALLIAAFFIWLVTRHLLGLLSALRRNALHTASTVLPEAVARIRHGEQVTTDITEVPVHTTEEVGEVARSFDAVHRQALNLAVEQASLRRGYSDSFVNVSRRSQGLLERQLRLFEKLEQDEQDPDQLSTLFQLDHLATRMRRNNENLMVLSGSDLARRFSRPTALADVLRAAVSEIEHYPRVVVQPPPAVKLVGYAASDLVRVAAELLDNAANFSSPETEVTVSASQASDGTLTLDVLDSGIGMGERDLAKANARLADPEESDLSSSRRLGLLVVSRLAERHGITVRLHGGSEVEGVRASLHLPADIVVGLDPTHTEQDAERRNPVAKRPSPTPRNGADPSSSAPHSPGQRNGSAFPTGAGSAIAGAAAAGTAAGGASAGGDLPRRAPEQGRAPEQPGSAPEQGRAPEQQGRAPEQGGAPEQAGRAQMPQRAAPDTGEPRRSTAERPAGSELPRRSRTQQPSNPQASTQQAGAPQTGTGLPRRKPTAPEAYQPDGTGAMPSLPAPETNAPTPAPQQEHRRDERPRGLFEPVQAEAGSADVSPPAATPPAETAELPRRTPGVNPPVSPRETVRTAQDGESGHTDAEWFHPSPEDARFQPGAGGGPEGHAWPQEEPSGAQAPAPQGATGTGLPRRTPQAQNEIPQSNAARTQRTPEDLRGKLSGYQHARKDGSGQDQAGPGDANGTSASGADAWNFDTDDAAQRAEAAANPDPSDFTSAGLPRRTPRAHLAPGSAPSRPANGTSSDAQSRNPDEVRGRLSNFQSGARRGRHSASDRR